MQSKNDMQSPATPTPANASGQAEARGEGEGASLRRGGEASHTPGPWVLCSEVEFDATVEVRPSLWLGAPNLLGFGRIAGVSTWRGQPEFIAEAQANARLIAAAPTMHKYIASAASDGCAEASKILEAINVRR